MKSFTIIKSEIGADKWPFTVDEVIIQIDDVQAIYVKVGKKLYNLNGIARKGKPLSKIWLDNTEIPGTKKSISFIFKLCGDRF